jgi:hypothetical protein
MTYFQTYYIVKTGNVMSDFMVDIFQLKELYRSFGIQISERVLVQHQNIQQHGIFSQN